MINMHTHTETEDHFLQAFARPKQILQKLIELATVKQTLMSSIDSPNGVYTDGVLTVR